MKYIYLSKSYFEQEREKEKKYGDAFQKSSDVLQ